MDELSCLVWTNLSVQHLFMYRSRQEEEHAQGTGWRRRRGRRRRLGFRFLERVETVVFAVYSCTEHKINTSLFMGHLFTGVLSTHTNQCPIQLQASLNDWDSRFAATHVPGSAARSGRMNLCKENGGCQPGMSIRTRANTTKLVWVHCGEVEARGVFPVELTWTRNPCFESLPANST